MSDEAQARELTSEGSHDDNAIDQLDAARWVRRMTLANLVFAVVMFPLTFFIFGGDFFVSGVVAVLVAIGGSVLIRVLAERLELSIRNSLLIVLVVLDLLGLAISIDAIYF